MKEKSEREDGKKVINDHKKDDGCDYVEEWMKMNSDICGLI